MTINICDLCGTPLNDTKSYEVEVKGNSSAFIFYNVHYQICEACRDRLQKESDRIEKLYMESLKTIQE